MSQWEIAQLVRSDVTDIIIWRNWALFHTPLYPGSKWRIFRMSPSFNNVTIHTSLLWQCQNDLRVSKEFLDTGEEKRKLDYTVATRYEFCVLVAKTICHEWAALARDILFLPLEHTIHILSPSCYTLYITVDTFPLHNAFKFALWQKKNVSCMGLLA